MPDCGGKLVMNAAEETAAVSLFGLDAGRAGEALDSARPVRRLPQQPTSKRQRLSEAHGEDQGRGVTFR